VDHEEALTLVRLVKVLLRVDLENKVAHLEADGLHLLGDFLARRLDMTEGLITVAVEVGQSLGPLEADLFEDIGRNGKLRATGIDNSRIASVLARTLHGDTSISHALTLESPRAKPVVEVLESLQALLATDDLRTVIATEESVRRFVHFLRSNTEGKHGVINNAVVLKRPQVVQLLLGHVLVGRQTQDTVRLVAETLRLVQSEELEVGALVLFQVELKLDETRLDIAVGLQRLDTCVVLPDETLKLGRAISQL